jgi:hypothetical protein
MRTTVSISDDLLARARELALRSHRPLGAVVDDALRLLLESADAGRGASVHLPVHGGSGLRPGVDLEDKDAMASLLDEERDARAAG